MADALWGLAGKACPEDTPRNIYVFEGCLDQRNKGQMTRAVLAMSPLPRASSPRLYGSKQTSRILADGDLKRSGKAPQDPISPRPDLTLPSEVEQYRAYGK